MDDSIGLSYAAVVKKSVRAKNVAQISTGLAKDKTTNEKPAMKSWIDQVEEFENDQLSRSNSLSTILSDDTVTKLTQSNVKRHSISHSLDSGQISDLSSDNEICSKSSHKNEFTNCANATRQRRTHIPFHRRESVDSCQTSSSTCCNDIHCTTNHDQLRLMCQRWGEVKSKERETDEGTLARRQKQIDYGKNTIGYELFCNQVPSDKRTNGQPQTPDKSLKYSRRAFDGLIKKWRKQLHLFDSSDSAIVECSDTSESTEEHCSDMKAPHS